MGATVEYGIRINIDGNKTAVDGIDQVKNATVKMGAAAEEVGQQIAASQKQVGNSTAQMTVGQQLFIEKIREQAATIGMSRSQLLEYQAAQIGVTNQVAQSIAKINEATEAQGKHSFSMGSALAKIELLRVGHDALIGSYSRMASSAFVLGNATGVTTAIFSAAAIPVIALTAAVAGVVAVAFIARNEIKAMDDALITTGNYAGQNASSMLEMSKQIGAVNHNVGVASDVLVGLANTGAIGSGAFKSVGTAATLMSKLTGQSAEESVKEFAKMEDGVVKFAQAHDKHYHDIKTATMEHIRELENQGQTEEAQRVAADAIADATQARLNRMRGELSTTAKSWNDLGTSAMNAWQDMKRAAALAIGIAPLQQELAARLDHQSGNVTASNMVTSLQDAMNGQNEAKRIAWLQNKIKESADADAAGALDTQIQAAGKKAEEQLSQNKAHYDRAYAKQLAINDLKRKFYDLSIANDGSKLMAGVDVMGDREHPQVSGGEYDKQLAGIEKDFAAKSAKAGSDVSKAMLDGQLKNIQDSVAAEKARYDQLNRLADLYHKDGRFSDTEFYAAKRANFEAMAVSETAGFDKQIDDLKAFHGKTEVARTENLNKIAQAEAAKAKVTQEYADKREILGIEEVDRVKAIMNASDDAMNKYLSGLNAEADKLEASNLGHEESKSAIERERVARLDLAIAYQTQVMAAQTLATATQAEIDQAPVILKYLQDQRALRERIAKGLDQADIDTANKKAADAASKSWDTTAKHIESTLADAIANGGGNAWKKLKAAIASQVLQVPLQMIGSVGASIMNPAAAQAQGGSAMLGTASNAYGMYNNAVFAGNALFGSGSGTVASWLGGTSAIAPTSVAAANLAGATGGDALGSLIATEGWSTGVAAAGGEAAAGAAAAGGEAAAAGSLSTALGAIPVWGWAAMAALAIAAIADGGETRGGGQYGYSFDGTLTNNRRGTAVANAAAGVNLLEGPSGGEIASDAVKSSITGTVTSINAMFKGLGSSAALTGFQAGIESSTEGRGGVFAGGTLSSGATFGASGKGSNYNGTLYDSAFSTSPDAKQALTDFSTELKQTTIQALQAATDIPKSISDQLKGVDAKKLTDATATALLTSISAEITGVNKFRDAVLLLPFENLKNLSFDAADSLIRLAGGIDQFSSKSGAYYQNFYTASEQSAQALKNVDAQMAELGLSGVTTREQFRKTVDGLNLTVDAEARQYTALMNLAPAFAQVHAALDDTTAAARTAADVLAERANLQQQLDQLTMTSAQLREKERTAIDAANVAIFDRITAIQNEAAASAAAAATYFAQIDYGNNVARLTSESGAALDKFFGTATDASNAGLSVAQAANAAAKTAGDNWRAIANTIRTTLESIRGQTEQIVGGYEVSMARFQALTVLARGGDADSAGRLAGAAQAYLTASESNSATMADYLRDRYKIENSLSETLGSTAALASAQDMVVQNTSATVSQLSAMNVTLSGFAADLYDVLQKGYAGANKDTASGVASTFATAAADYTNWFNTVRDGESVEWGKGSMTAMSGGIGRYDDANGNTLAYVRASESMLDAAKRSPELRAVWEEQYGIKLPAFAAGGAYQGGLALVGEQGPELINFSQPGQVYTASQTRSMMSGDNAALVAEIRALRQEVSDLKSLQREGNASTRQLADQFDEVSEGGNSIRTAITEDMTK